MANALFDAGRNAFARGDILWKATGGSTIKVVLIDTGAYTVNLSTHANLSDVAAGARIVTATLTLIDPSAGVCDASDVNFGNVSGAQSEALIIYKDTGVEATSTLIAYIDTATGLPVTPSGGPILITWDSGANKIFKL